MVQNAFPAPNVQYGYSFFPVKHEFDNSFIPAGFILASGGHIATIVAGPGARPNGQLRTPVDQYSILQAVEDLLGLARLRGASCPCTPTLAPLIAHIHSQGPRKDQLRMG